VAGAVHFALILPVEILTFKVTVAVAS